VSKEVQVYKTPRKDNVQAQKSGQWFCSRKETGGCICTCKHRCWRTII